MPEDPPGSHHVMIAVRDVGLSAQQVSTRGPTSVVQFTSPKSALLPGHRDALLDSSLWAEIVRSLAPQTDTVRNFKHPLVLVLEFFTVVRNPGAVSVLVDAQRTVFYVERL